MPDVTKLSIDGVQYDLKDTASGFITASSLPTKVSQLENDAGYLTQHQDISGVVRADVAQSLTDEQKQQARENIGAGTGSGGASVIETTFEDLGFPSDAPREMSADDFVQKLWDLGYRPGDTISIKSPSSSRKYILYGADFSSPETRLEIEMTSIVISLDGVLVADNGALIGGIVATPVYTKGSGLLTLTAGRLKVKGTDVTRWRLLLFKKNGLVSSWAHPDKTIGASGRVVFDNGCIIQWGYTTAVYRNGTVTFPVAFSDYYSIVMATVETGNGDPAFYVKSHDTTGFSYSSALGSSVAGMEMPDMTSKVVWLAFGG